MHSDWLVLGAGSLFVCSEFGGVFRAGAVLADLLVVGPSTVNGGRVVPIPIVYLWDVC